eukprot:CAMPEP_0195511386 /NCGR_PEP_ID=MMETSP0794_2-20130614/3719_1 /TAXON_ID=515487 /ORGANISM="Stephanopyxis turris, Strain CCMP 815" /LENGTH=350 /DNA_ID=CAMNT_0040638971 /DNA_START=318 /DNA_END=1371 /DNA_ORIENTATION=+
MLVNNNAMITAIKDQNWAGVKRLCVSDPSMCQSKDSNGYLAIHHACSYGSPVEIVKEICNAYEHGMKITDVKGLLPLHLACVSDMSLEGSKYIHQLHQEGVEAKSKYGNIPLHLACQYASAEIIEYLHRMYPDGVTVKNDFDKTPLDSLKWRDQLRNDEDAILAIFNRIPSPLSMRPEISPNISDESHAKKSWHHDNQSLTENPNEADADSTILDAARKYVTVMDNWYAAKKARADAKINRRTQEKAVKETIESFQKAKARETLVTAKLKEAAAIADLNKANDEKEEANHLFHRNGDNNVLRSCATGTLDKMNNASCVAVIIMKEDQKLILLIAALSRCHVVVKPSAWIV